MRKKQIKYGWPSLAKFETKAMGVERVCINRENTVTFLKRQFQNKSRCSFTCDT